MFPFLPLRLLISQVEWMCPGHHPHHKACFHHWELQPWEIQFLELLNETSLGFAAFILDDDTLRLALVKISSVLCNLLEDKLEKT